MAGLVLGRNVRLSMLRHALLTLCMLLGAPQLSQAQAVSDPYNQTRTVSFSYGANGLLEREVVEPDVTALCVQTTYEYDGAGNRVRSTTANCAGASGPALFATRGSRSEYAAASKVIGSVTVAIPAGTFATSSKVAVSPGLAAGADPATDTYAHNESREHDPRYGALTRLQGPNGLVTTWDLDDLGRVARENRADGTYSVSRYCYIPGRISGYDPAQVNSAGCAASAPAETPAAAIYYQESQSYNSANAATSGWARQYQDAAGRVIRVATQAYDGANQPGGTTRVVVQDTEHNAHGLAVAATKPYFWGTRSTGTGGSNDVGLVRTEYDFGGRVLASHATDPTTSNTVAFGTIQGHNHGTLAATTTRVVYQGLQTTLIDAAGKTRVEEKNPEGKLIRTTDAYGAQVVHQHDALGNLVKTRDALGNVITVVYDQRGRKVRLEDPDAGAVAYCYDALGQLKAQQNSKMRGSHGASSCPSGDSSGTSAQSHDVAGWSTLAYDRLGRLTQRIDPEYTSTWYHDRDAANQLCGASIGKTCQSGTTHGITRKTQYDSLGRPSKSRVDVSGGPSMASGITYDTSGRPSIQTYPSGLRVQRLYTTLGALRGVQSLTTLNVGGSAQATLLWDARAVDAAGRVERQVYGNGVHTRATYEARSGRLTHLGAGTAADQFYVMDNTLGWNALGQLVQRVDAIGDGSTPAVAIADAYQYDELGRMVTHTVSGNGSPSVRSVQLQYNAAGMLLYKSDVGIYTYTTQGSAWGQPHALRSVAGAHGATYGYDLNGNLTSATGGKYRTVAYTSFNLPDGSTGLQGAAGSPKYTWQYDENRQRMRETRVNAQGTRMTWSLHPDNAGGLGFEREVPASGAAQNRHYISAGGGAIGVVVTEGSLPDLDAVGVDGLPPALASAAVARLEYWHKDHLGSLVATSNHAAVTSWRNSYDPFGKRRYLNSSYDPFGNIVVDWGTGGGGSTDRGYTGHEHLDEVGVIHMNGRTYDPITARFMQADPLIQEPDNLQNYDRYGYCFNNPATCTDPSGYASFRQHLRAMDTFHRRPNIHTSHQAFKNVPWQKGIDRYLMDNEFAYNVARIVIAYFTVGFGVAHFDGYYTYERTGSANAAFKVAAVGVATNLAFMAVGSYTSSWGANYGAMGYAGQIGAHALVGCASAEMGGGNCGEGALAAGFGKAASLAGPDWVQNPNTDIWSEVAAGTAFTAIAGGIGAELGGGKFANGAQTAAMGYLFNQLSKLGDCAFNARACSASDATRIRGWAATCEGRTACIMTLREHATRAGLIGPNMGAVLLDTGQFVFDWGISILVAPVAAIDRFVITPGKLGYELVTGGDWGVTAVGAGSSELANAALKGVPARTVQAISGYFGRTQGALAGSVADEQRVRNPDGTPR